MTGIVLSASVRQNLLSLQSTAELLSTTQNRLATGNKVNSALDNPTNFFTSQGLNNRSNDINNLLDSIGNGVQVLQAANTGLTSLQKLVDTAKSVANQVQCDHHSWRRGLCCRLDHWWHHHFAGQDRHLYARHRFSSNADLLQRGRRGKC
jgi:hypothetical protein